MKTNEKAYTSSDLAGMTKSHDINDIQDDTILVLKDTYINDNDSDQGNNNNK